MPCAFTYRIRCFFHPRRMGVPETGQVDGDDDRTFLDLGQLRTARAAHRLADQVLDRQFHVGPTPFVVHDHHVFESDEGSEDLTRLAKNEGASWLLGHTSSLRDLRRARDDPGQDGFPARIRRAPKSTDDLHCRRGDLHHNYTASALAARMGGLVDARHVISPRDSGRDDLLRRVPHGPLPRPARLVGSR